MKNKLCILYIFLILCLSCVNTDFDGPTANCVEGVDANISFSELGELYEGEVIQVQEDLFIEGFVISSDRSGNFFNVLHIQDHPTMPTQGLQLEMDLRESHLLYPMGSNVLVRLKGLYLGKSGDMLKLGGTFNAFGNLSVGRLPSLKIPEHIFLGCNSETVLPVKIKIEELPQWPTGILVQLDSIEVADDELGKTYAEPKEETIRVLQDCGELQILMLNSGFADFQAEILPEGNGSITGVLLKVKEGSQIAVRSLDDVQFSNERCPEIITEFTSDRIFISELADPDNNTGARFVELYNSDIEPLDLNLWTLRRYTNDNLELGSSIDLSRGQYLRRKARWSSLQTLPSLNWSTDFHRILEYPPTALPIPMGTITWNWWTLLGL